MLWISIIIALIILIIGSITDIKKREVHDFVSYGLIFAAFGMAILYSILYWDYKFLVQTLFGFIIGIIIAYAMFYLGQWGGGDSKLIMGLGAVLGFNAFDIFGAKDYWLMILLVNIVFVGAIYGLIWSIFLAIKHRKEFIKSLKIWSEKKQIILIRRILLAIVVICAVIILFFIPQELKILFISFLAVVFVVFYLWLFIKIIEESCMIKKTPVEKLTEGDWIYKDVYLKKKFVVGPKDLGISKEQIAKLNNYSKKHKIGPILVKEGIPFIPAFLIAYIITITMYYSNITMLSLIMNLL